MKKLLVFTLLTIAFFQGHTQNTDYSDRMEHIFGNIDKAKVTTGYLKEFGIRFNEVEAYNGIISSTNLVDKTQWQSLYSSLYTMRVGMVAQNMTAPNVVFDNLSDQQDTAIEDVLLAALYYNYQQYKTNAVSNGDVTVNNDQISDIAGRNPYDTKTIFGVAPLTKKLQGDTFTFKLPSGLIYTNNNLSLNQVQVNFDDGNGYQIISLNTAKSITYTSGGEKDIKVKMFYTNGPILYSQSKILVDYIASNGGTQARFNGFGADLIFDEEPITGDSYQGSSATGLVTVELAPGHTELTKPLIVVEGFDPENEFNYFTLINSNRTGGLRIDLNPNPSVFYSLNQAIEDEDYDLVFVDFEDSTTHIQRNAYMLEAVISWVNGLKQTAGSTEQNVVLGMSMGGLVARYALRHMEIDNDPNTNHDTKLYVSHDTPHQGANVPLAFQAMVRHLYGEQISIPILFSLIDFDIASVNSLFPDIGTGYDLLQSPAAQQMLIYQLQGTGDGVSIDNSTLHDSFSTELANMGYPSQGGIRNIAIANGSECGNPLDFNAYDTLVNVNETIDLSFLTANLGLAFVNLAGWNPLKVISSFLSTNTDIKAQFNLKALPNQKSKQIYKGKIFIRKAVLGFIIIHEDLIDQETLNSSSTMLPLDNANGGIFDLEGFADLPAEFDQYIIERQFNFIPTYSSLDIGKGNVTIGARDINKAYSPLSPPSAPKDTPFDNFFTNELNSEQHIQFTLNNGNWLMAELDDDPMTEAFFSCASTCPNDLPLSVNGADQICHSNSETYFVNTLKPGIPVTWSLSSPGGFTMTTSGNSVTLTPNGNVSGIITLTATIETDCDDVIINKDIQTGAQRPIIYDENGDQVGSFTFCMLNYDGFSFETQPGVVEWQWNNPSNNFAMTASNNGAQFYNPTPASGFINVKVRDNCGWSAPTFMYINLIDCSSGGGGFGNFRVMQNPVNSETLTVVETDEGQSNLGNSNSQGNNGNSNGNQNNSKVTLEFYDFNGTLLKTKKVNRNQLDRKYHLNVSQFDNNNYFIRIIYNDINEVYQVIIDN